MNPAQSSLLFLLLILAFISGCKKEPGGNNPLVILSEARLADFKLAEVAYTGIVLTHPTVVNNVETARGQILVTIPRGTTGLRLTPLASNFTSKQFTISPVLGQVQDFSAAPVTFTLTAKADASKKVHYDVRITEEQGGGQPDPTASITAFTFEKAKNPALPGDISASRIEAGLATLGKIYVFVPAGTNFSALTPTIQHNGAQVYYSQDPLSPPANSTTVYPVGGISIDFAYPKAFYLTVKNGTLVNTYEVLVDVKNPIRFDHAAVTTVAVAKGTTHFIPAGSFINQGNHPLSLAGVDHTNEVPLGLAALRASSAMPSFGLLPGDRAVVNATVSAAVYPPGTYQVTSVFRPAFYNQPGVASLLEPSTITITTVIND